MKRSSVILFACLVAAGCLLTLTSYSQEATETRVTIKTSLPPGADLAHSRTISFADLAAFPEPPGVQANDSRYEKTRIPVFPNGLGLKEGDVVRVRGWLQIVSLMGDGDYNLRLTATAQSRDHYIVCELPDKDDIADPALQKMVVKARNFLKAKFLEGHDPLRTGTVLPDPAYIEVSGQLFFNDRTAGMAPHADRQGTVRATNWQIHPLLNVSLAPISPQ